MLNFLDQNIALAKAQNVTMLPLTIDGIFKLFFEDPRNLPELRGFLKAYLDLSNDDLSEIQVLNPGLLKESINDKGFTVDLLLKTKTGNALHIEMQTSYKTNYKERFQLCNARKAGQQVKVGEQYTKVRRTISLIVTNFTAFTDSDKSHERIVMRRENGKIFTNAQELNFIDLTKAEEDDENNREKYLWSKLFKVTTWEELEMVAKESEEMAEAADKLLQLSRDERAQAYAESREHSEFAWKLHMQGVRDEVRKEERIKSDAEKRELRKEERIKADAEKRELRKEERIKADAEKRELLQQDKIRNAQKMMEDNFSDEMIERYTGLSMDKIKLLK